MCSAIPTWVRPHAGRLGAAHSPQLATENTCLSVCESPSLDDAPRLKAFDKAVQEVEEMAA